MADASEASAPFLVADGDCPICGPEVRFTAADTWLRDSFLCGRCHSLPRERALMAALDAHAPQWRTLDIHESSPVWRGTSLRLRHEAPGYSFSYFDPTLPLGAEHFVSGATNQNIERMRFDSQSFDLFLTQDVFEHIFRPDLAIREIERVLRPGGLCLMTVPMVNKSGRSERCAELLDGVVNHIKTPEFHGDPVNAEGTLVVFNWGYELCARLAGWSGMSGIILMIDDISRGIRAEYNEVIVLHKPLLPPI